MPIGRVDDEELVGLDALLVDAGRSEQQVAAVRRSADAASGARDPALRVERAQQLDEESARLELGHREAPAAAVARLECAGPELGPERGSHDPDVGDVARDEGGGGDVERGVPRRRVGGREAVAPRGPHLVGIALLDDDGRTVGRVEVEGRVRSGDPERDAMVPRQHGEAVGADLVGRIAVRRDAVAADDDGIHQAMGHRRAGGRVDDEPVRHPGLRQLPRGEPRALEQRTRLAREDLVELAGGVHRVDDRERGAVASGREPARVAVGQQTARPGQRDATVRRDRRAARPVLDLESGRLGQRCRSRARPVWRRGRRAMHAPDGHREVHRGRTRRREARRECVKDRHQRRRARPARGRTRRSRPARRPSRSRP